MATANENLQSEITRRQVDIIRVSNGLAISALRTLAATEAGLRDYLTRALEDIESRISAARARQLGAVERNVSRIRGRGFAAAEAEQRRELATLAATQAAWIPEAMQRAIPVRITPSPLATRSIDQLIELGLFDGRTITRWWSGMEAAELTRIMSAIRSGVAAGQTTADIVRAVMGTRTVPGALQPTRNDVQAVTRTLTTGVNAEVYDDFYRRNADIVAKILWVSTLDGRTSQTCRGLDGQTWNVDEPHPTPPAHPNCRSSIAPIVDGFGIVGARPFVRDTKGKWYRRKFKSDAERRRWIAENIGSVPAKTTYDAWLRQQPDGFQREVLPQWQYEEFKKGTPLKHFVSKNLEPLTLKEFEARK